MFVELVKNPSVGATNLYPKNDQFSLKAQWICHIAMIFECYDSAAFCEINNYLSFSLY